MKQVEIIRKDGNKMTLTFDGQNDVEFVAVTNGNEDYGTFSYNDALAVIEKQKTDKAVIIESDVPGETLEAKIKVVLREKSATLVELDVIQRIKSRAEDFTADSIEELAEFALNNPRSEVPPVKWSDLVK
ncbi:MAG: hypothetical protein ACU843_17495 [Gammaproteobacteria bacterium]